MTISPTTSRNRDIDADGRPLRRRQSRTASRAPAIKAAFLKLRRPTRAGGKRGTSRRSQPSGSLGASLAHRGADHGALDAGGRYRNPRQVEIFCPRRASTSRGCRSPTAATPTDPRLPSRGSWASGVCMLGLDRYGLEMFPGRSNKRNATAAELLRRRGTPERSMIISQDYCGHDRLVPGRGQGGLRRPGARSAAGR